jgi:hypothetical protein
MELTQVKDVNPVDLVSFKYVILTEPKATLEVLEKRVA